MNPSLSKTNQADVIEGKELPSTRQKEPSMYKVWTDSGKGKVLFFMITG